MDKSSIEVRKLPASGIFALIIAACFAAGAVFGIRQGLAAGNELILNRLSQKLSVNLYDKGVVGSGVAAVFAAGLFKYGKTLLIVWFLAFIPALTPLLLVLVFTKSAGLGYTTTLLYILYGEAGYWHAAALYLPQSFIMIPAIFHTAFGSACYAAGTVRAGIIVRRAKKSGLAKDTVRPRLLLSAHATGASGYAAYMMTGLGCAALAAVAEGLLTPMLLKLLF